MFQTALMGSQGCCPACLPLLVCSVGSQCSPGCVQSCSVDVATPRLCGWLCACRAGGAAGPAQGCFCYWQLLQRLSATAHQDFQASSPEFPSPSLSWPAERPKNFYLWSTDEVTGPEDTVAGNPVCLSLCHAKGLWLAVLHMPQPSAV